MCDDSQESNHSSKKRRESLVSSLNATVIFTYISEALGPNPEFCRTPARVSPVLGLLFFNLRLHLQHSAEARIQSDVQ